MACVLLVAATLALLPTAALATAMFMGLGVLPGAGSSTATAISADGSTVVGNSGSQAFRWTAGTGMVPIGIGSANAVSGDGSEVVGGCGSQACSWTAGGGAVSLGILPGQSSSTAYGVSADGSTIVGVSGEQAFRWTAATGMIGLGFLPGQDTSIAYGVSGDGSVVAGASGIEGIRWTEADGMTGIGALTPEPQFYSEARAVSADGSTIVGSSYEGDETAFLWKQGDLMSLGRNPFIYSAAYAVSSDGSTVVGCGGNGSFCEQAFLWDADHGGRDLRQVLLAAGVDAVDGWATAQATGISADGRTIVGWGDPNFFSGGEEPPTPSPQAWIARLPEPSTDALLLVGLVGLVVTRRRRW